MTTNSTVNPVTNLEFILEHALAGDDILFDVGIAFDPTVALAGHTPGSVLDVTEFVKDYRRDHGDDRSPWSLGLWDLSDDELFYRVRVRCSRDEQEVDNSPVTITVSPETWQDFIRRYPQFVGELSAEC